MVFLCPSQTVKDRSQGGAVGDMARPPRSGGRDHVTSLSISNNCTEKGDALNVLTGRHKNVAECIRVEIKMLCDKYGIERIGFVTITFADEKGGFDMKEAQRRMHSLMTHVLSKRYKKGIIVTERGGKKERIHFHCILVMRDDIRTGFDFSEIEKAQARRKKRKPYRFRSANPALRTEWAFWAETGPKYGFGQVETFPVRSNEEGIAKYVGKYVAKHVDHRKAEDKGHRMVRFFGYKKNGVSTRSIVPTFSRATINGWLWRKKTERFAKQTGVKTPEGLAALCAEMKGNQENEKTRQSKTDKRWAHYFQASILAVDLTAGEGIVYPTRDHALADGQSWAEDLPFDAVDVFKQRKDTRPGEARLDPIWIEHEDEPMPIRQLTPAQRQAAQEREQESGRALRLHLLMNPAQYMPFRRDSVEDDQERKGALHRARINWQRSRRVPAPAL